MKMLSAALLLVLGIPQNPPAAVIPAGPQQNLPATQIEQSRQPQSLDTPIDLNLRDAALVPALNTIARYYGLNLLIPPDVSGPPINVDLRGLTLTQALDAILLPRGMVYRIAEGMLRVDKLQPETRSFKFDYITTQRTLSRSLSASSSAGGGASLGGLGGGAAAGGGGLAAGIGGGGGGGSSASLAGTESTNLLLDVEAQLQKFLSPAGKYVFNKMAGVIIVSDFPVNLDAVGFFLETIQNAVNRQVVIEAKVVEVKLNDSSQFGVNWTAVLGNALRLEQPFVGSGGFQITATRGDFSAVLTALASQGTVNVLSSPTIATLNNQPAIMRVGTQDIFFTTTTQVDPRTGSIVQTATVPSAIHEGIVLDVTPQISDDGVIAMNVHPTITERTGQVTSPQGLSVPIVDVRETDTVVRVKEGGTVMIGGLISDRTIENAEKVPILGDIPLFGGLFKRSTKELRKTDLVILLTPRLLDLQTAVDYTRSRIENQERLKTQGR